MKRLVYCATIVALTAAPVAANHVDFIQDDSNPSNGVTDATFSLSTSGGVVSDAQPGEPADILGGTRQVTLTGGGIAGSISAEKVAGTDFISVENDTLSAGILTLSYPGISNSNFASNWNAIGINIPFIEQSTGIGDGEIDISVTVNSSAGSGTALVDGNGIVPGRVEDPGTFFALFNDPGFAAVDFSDVDGVTVTFTTAIIGSDYRIGSITRETVIPEPASAILLGGMALLAVSARRRR